MLKFVSGNLLQSNAHALVNTVNTVGVMGKGIALQFKNEFPHNYTVYREACFKHELETGHLLVVKDTSLLMGERLVINFPTKTDWRLPSKYTYLAQGLIALADLITTQKLQTIALPALGCGNGSLDWLTVKKMICRQLESFDAFIEVYEPTR
jgi:O-acetyl-ADP-ribose deacetylase (regulator of RNase III)